MLTSSIKIIKQYYFVLRHIDIAISKIPMHFCLKYFQHPPRLYSLLLHILRPYSVFKNRAVEWSTVKSTLSMPRGKGGVRLDIRIKVHSNSLKTSSRIFCLSVQQFNVSTKQNSDIIDFLHTTLITLLYKLSGNCNY